MEVWQHPRQATKCMQRSASRWKKSARIKWKEENARVMLTFSLRKSLNVCNKADIYLYSGRNHSSVCSVCFPVQSAYCRSVVKGTSTKQNVIKIAICSSISWSYKIYNNNKFSSGFFFVFSIYLSPGFRYPFKINSFILFLAIRMVYLLYVLVLKRCIQWMAWAYFIFHALKCYKHLEMLL